MLKRNHLNDLKVDALRAAKELEGPINFISIETSADRKRVKVQIHLAGIAGDWIEYDAEQLDELIRLLSAHRTDLTR